MAAKKTPPTRSGPNIPEAQRGEHGQQKKLRWSSEQVAALATLAARWGMTESAAAARAIEEALVRR